ncbi:MAG TPA: SPOR domain-containing protein [Desulfosporosinus sp.]|nr:SPOR domain-containing protein [Desulfosporosinus sp.]
MRLSERIRVIVVVIIGIMAIGLLTSGVGKIYLELVGQSNRTQAAAAVQANSEEANLLTDTVLILPTVNFWTCQVGVFQNEANAQLKKDQLRVLNLNAEVISTEPWTVGIFLGHSADDLKGLRQSLANKGISTLPKQFVLPERSFRVAGNGTQLTVEILTNVNTILQKGWTVDALAKEKKAWDALAGDYPPKQLEGLHRLYSKVNEETTLEEQRILSLSLFFESQRVINKLSGK